MSLLPTFDCNGTCSQYRISDSAKPQDALEILSEHAVNTVRLRLFGPDTTPNNSYADLDGVLAMAKRAKAAGLEISLDIFYSQWYADSYYYNRRTPPRWKNLTFSELTGAAGKWTLDAMQALALQGTIPTTVQIGNEINCGLFHPWIGKSCSSGAEVCDCKNNWENLAAIINAGYRAIKYVNPDAEVLIQYAASETLGDGDPYGNMYNFYTSLDKAGAQFDAMALSFYQIWGAHHVHNLCTMKKLAIALPSKGIYVIETGYPYRSGGRAPQNMKPSPQFPLSPEGQIQWLQAVVYTVEHGLWGRGRGVSWWGTEYAKRCSGNECSGFWDSHYVALPILTTNAFASVKSIPTGAKICDPL